MPSARPAGHSVWPLTYLVAVIVSGLLAGCGGQRNEAPAEDGSDPTSRAATAPGSTAGPAGEGTAGPASSAGPAAQGGPASTAGPAGQGTAGRAPGGTPGPSSPLPSHRHRIAIIDWISDLAPLGEGASGGAEEAWASFVDGSCDGPVSTPMQALPVAVRSVYLAGNAACQAAFHGRPDLWAVAESRIGAAESHAAELDCTEAAVLRVTRALIALHRQDPTARLSRGRPSGRTYGTCPKLTSVRPTHGPAAGGYEVVLAGSHLPARPTIIFWIDDGVNPQITEVRRVGVSNAGGTRTTVVMPAGPPGGDAAMYVRGYPYLVQGQPSFSYDRAARPTAVPSPSAGRTGTPAPPTSTGPPPAAATTPRGLLR